ncbi:MAG: TetR/AcrR family transcriptional regulator [Cuneatibacter sp.]|nr:TetR/AcrR family transcriptional regulator [Cuneatibacter sp.]
MPRKFLFTREEIVEAAVQLTRKSGISAVTARGLGERLGTSSKPIFSHFENMEQVQQAVLMAANEKYQNYLKTDMASGKHPPYKASGMAYIRFAREERELFKLLFMRDRSGETIEENKEEIRPLLALIEKNLGISEQAAYRFHLEMWVYVHGIASMIATSYLDWDDEMASEALSDAYQGLRHRFTEKES